MTVFDIIKSRRSIRKYSSKDIEEEKLQTILEAGRLAPSWRNNQCWRFVVVRNKEKINQLASKSGLISKVNYFINDTPIVIVACANPKESGFMNEQHYYLVDTAIAFQQMMLTAWEMGIGSCWLGAFNEKKVKQILKIPIKIKVVALSPFGYPAKKEGLYAKTVKVFAGSKNRKSLDEIVHYDIW